MAQNIDDIQQAILTEKAEHPELDDLNSVSTSAIYKLWAYVIAVVLHLQQTLWDFFKIEITEIADRKQYGTKAWWAQKVKEYQHGDLLDFIANVYKYAAIDPDKQIVKFVSIDDPRGLVKIKAAKLSGEDLVQLSEDQVNGLQDYAEEIRPAGTRVIVESLSADLLKMILNVYYNASADLPVVQANVEAAIAGYLSSLDFDGVFYINKLIDAIQAVPGIVKEQVVITEIAAKTGGDPYTQISVKYQAKSGYFKIDPAFPLSINITYLT